jgi:hypothetical protein
LHIHEDRFFQLWFRTIAKKRFAPILIALGATSKAVVQVANMSKTPEAIGKSKPSSRRE